VRRQIFSVASLLSLLLCGATAALWVRVGLAGEQIYGDFDWLGQINASESDGLIYRHWAKPSRALMWWDWRGFYYETNQIYVNGNDKAVGVMWNVGAPYWFVVGVTAILPLIWTGQRIRRIRRTSGSHCSVCSYDLTGNTSGTCPECGSPIPSSAATCEPKGPQPT